MSTSINTYSLSTQLYALVNTPSKEEHQEEGFGHRDGQKEGQGKAPAAATKPFKIGRRALAKAKALAGMGSVAF